MRDVKAKKIEWLGHIIGPLLYRRVRVSASHAGVHVRSPAGRVDIVMFGLQDQYFLLNSTLRNLGRY